MPRALALLSSLFSVSALLLSCSLQDGSEIFRRENCIYCHKFHGLGYGSVDLSEVTEKRSRVWIRDQLKNPTLHKPDSGMPSFAHLSELEVKALIRFLDSGDGGT